MRLTANEFTTLSPLKGEAMREFSMGRITVPTVFALAFAVLPTQNCPAEQVATPDKQVETVQRLTELRKRLEVELTEKAETLRMLEKDSGLGDEKSQNFRLQTLSNRLVRLEERKLDAEQRLLRVQYELEHEDAPLKKQESEFLVAWITSLEVKIEETTTAIDCLLGDNPHMANRRNEVELLRSQHNRVSNRLFELELERVSDSGE